MDTVTGELVAHRVVGDDFWSIATVRTKKGKVALTGKLLGAELGDTIEVQGLWVDHKTFGRQFKVKSCAVTLPQSDNGVIAWMSGRLNHVGKERARAMLSHFGGAEALWSVIEDSPARLVEVSGITEKRANEIAEAYARFHHERDRMIRFKRWGLTDNQIAKVIGKWGDDAEELMRKNPYQLADHIDGFGFIKADVIAQRMGVPSDAVPRIRCGLMHTMKQAAGHGHCYVASGKLVSLASKNVLRLDGDIVALQLKLMRKDGSLVQHGKRTFMKSLDRFECICADRIRALLSQRK